jgi:antitoxin component of MazEF toxin-antitoxin module
MPIVRKLMNVGNSKSITLPKSWIENAEQQAGKKIIAIALEVNGKITLQPVFSKESEASR